MGPTGPYATARLCEEKIVDLEGERDALPRSEQKAMNQRLHQLRQMRQWYTTRSRYQTCARTSGGPLLVLCRELEGPAGSPPLIGRCRASMH